MAVWKERCSLLTSLLLCVIAAVLGTLLYPFILLFFSAIALVYSIFRRLAPSRSSSGRAPPEGSGA